ncbi:fatty acid desaturase family protein [Streptomyces sp. NPDC020607]|uniref:fatty acid desaturase family protein n=1 Tax=Streptomyces sp. NPDC020607 TaxID=3365082 RepID=UPI0037A05FAF
MANHSLVSSSSQRAARLEIPTEVKKFTLRDSRIFASKVALAGALAAISCFWILTHGWLAALPAQLLLGLVYAHAVELQHQALHGTGFRSARKSRVVGTALGAPLLVSYSRYRALHLLHHRYLGTDKDTEFFDYAAVERLTLWTLASSAFNVRRWFEAGADVARSLSPRTTYDEVITNPAVHGRIRTEYRTTLAATAALGLLSWWTGSPLILTLWLIPLLFAEPIHFLIELPEHIFCDRSTQDVFKNTRSIRGGWFSFWLTNGNNFHVEHHVRMGTPINKLPQMHPHLVDHIENYCGSYGEFYRDVLRRALRPSSPIPAA